MINQDDVIYFLLTDRFQNGDPANDHGVVVSEPARYHGGDFAGIESRIPYLLNLGVTAVWITPVYLSIDELDERSAGYHGYWALDFEKVDPRLYSTRPGRAEGSREYVKDLVDRLHEAGLKVILDMVVNHTGYHNETYRRYPDKKIEDDWFNHGSGEVEGELAGLPDLDHDQPRVIDYFVHNILDWVGATGIDGIRMDTVKHVEDAFWYFFKSSVKSRHPEITLIGEVLHLDPDVVGRYQQEHDFDTLFDFPLRQAVVDTLVWDVPMTRLARPRLHPDEPRGILDRESPYTNANRLVTLLDNHDLERRITSEILLRTPDSELALDILRLCLTFQFTTRGIPQLYYGSEIGLEGGRDPDNRRDMPWEIFEAGVRPRSAHSFEGQVFEHVTSLIRLRKAHPAIRYGYLLTLFVDHFLYAYLREFRGDVILVVINNGVEPMPQPVMIELAANSNIPPRIKGLLEDKPLEGVSGGVGQTRVESGRLTVQVPGKTAAVWTLPSI